MQFKKTLNFDTLSDCAESVFGKSSNHIYRSVQIHLIIITFALQIFPQSTPASLVILNANVRTMDAKVPKAKAIAVSGNVISAIGSNEEISKFIGENTQKIDAVGKLILPGFNDAHVHFLSIGNQFFTINLRNTKSASEAVEIISKLTKILPAGEWVLGGFWNINNWNLKSLPTKELIDSATPDHPVFLYQEDAQIALVNTVALRLAGFDKKTKTVSNGVIDRDENGEATGIIRGDAIKYLKSFTPNLADKREPVAAQAASNYAASLGITSVQDVHSDYSVGIYQELHRQGKLKTRVYDCYTLPNWEKLANQNVKRATGSAMIRQGCLKYFSDGEFEVLPEMAKLMIAADNAELQVTVHAIGSNANQIVLSAFEQVEKANGKKDRRFRIEHAHRMRSEDIGRFAATNTIASMQPHLFFGGVFNSSEPYRSLLASGARLAFGSDASITDFNPILGIYAAVHRGSSKDASIQTISVEEAVRAYTIGSAFAEFQENVKGTISPGKLADFVMLSEDIFTIPTESIPNAKVLLTVVDGKIVFESKF